MDAKFFAEMGVAQPYTESGDLTADAVKAIETAELVIRAIVFAGYQIGVSEASLIAEIREDTGNSSANETLCGDAYKVKALNTMLAHEESAAEEHYGAHLSHWYGDAKHLTIDAGGLRALLRHYQTHQTCME